MYLAWVMVNLWRKVGKSKNKSEKGEEELTKPLNNKFKEELVVYEEPVNLPNDYGEYERFDVEKLDDFTQTN